MNNEQPRLLRHPMGQVVFGDPQRCECGGSLTPGFGSTEIERDGKRVKVSWLDPTAAQCSRCGIRYRTAEAQRA